MLVIQFEVFMLIKKYRCANINGYLRKKKFTIRILTY